MLILELVMWAHNKTKFGKFWTNLGWRRTQCIPISTLYWVTRYIFQGLCKTDVGSEKQNQCLRRFIFPGKTREVQEQRPAHTQSFSSSGLQQFCQNSGQIEQGSKFFFLVVGFWRNFVRTVDKLSKEVNYCSGRMFLALSNWLRPGSEKKAPSRIRTFAAPFAKFPCHDVAARLVSLLIRSSDCLHELAR